MRILYVHDALELGGTEHVAIDWARGLRDLGHTVLFSSRPGTLDSRLAELGFEHLVDTSGRLVPHHAGAARLRAIVRDHHIDLVHSLATSTARPDLESFFGPHLRDGTPLVLTALHAPGLDLPRRVPHTVPVIVGRPSFARQFDAHGRPTFVVRPAVDVDDRASAEAGAECRARWSIGADETLVLLVSRVPRQGPWLPSVLDTIDAIGRIPPSRTPRLVVVGHGDGEDEVRRHVAGVNQLLGRDVVQFVGPVSDLAPAYAAADVVVGMATSALRGMAAEVPTIVLGLDGAATLAEPSLLDRFLANGVFAVRDDPTGRSDVATQLLRLLDDPEAARRIGAAGRTMMLGHWSTDATVGQLERAYEQVLERRVPWPATVADAANVACRHFALRARIRLGLRTRLQGWRDRALRTTRALCAAR